MFFWCASFQWCPDLKLLPCRFRFDELQHGHALLDSASHGRILHLLHRDIVGRYRIVGIFLGWNLRELLKSRIFAIKTFANCGKQPHPTRIFAVKTFTNCHKTAKFVKELICKRFPLYGTSWISSVQWVLQRVTILLVANLPPIFSCNDVVKFIKSGT